MTQHTDDVRYIASLTERVRAGDPCAMLSLANCYFYGIRGVARDNDQGVLLLQQAVAGGDRNAMLKLATCFSTGEGMPKDLDKAQHWYLTARDARGLHDVGHDYYYGDGKGPTRRDVDKAVSAWAKAVDLGDDRAMGQLGWCYQHGVGVECDKHRAVSLYNDAIAKNKSNSWRLGVCYLRGEGVERDWARAVQLFQQSGGSGDAKAYLGWCYLWGCGAERDVAKAVAMLQSAAASSAKAMVFLGYCLERGIGAAKDPGRADALIVLSER
ncbi:serine/threonine protein kinase [Pelomyxa schiedti]|nr:serine/threonine protein kinase [Pelomyxa schiedti]